MKERFNNWKAPDINKDGWTVYGWRCQHPKGLSLGKNIDIGCFTYLNAHNGIKIGDNTQIGSHCSIYSHDSERDRRGQVIIGKNVLIGTHVVIFPNVRIPDNAKIPSGSILDDRLGVTFITKSPEWRELYEIL